MADPIEEALTNLRAGRTPEPTPDAIGQALEALRQNQAAPQERAVINTNLPKPTRALDQPEAFVGGVVRGIPVIGNALADGVDSVNARIDAAIGQAPSYEAALEARRARSAGIRKENPGTTLAGEVVGGVASMAPVVAAAPAMFGARAGASMAERAALGFSSGGIVAGADTLAKTGDPEQAKTAAMVGGVVGAVATPIGAKVGELLTRRSTTARIPSIDDLEARKTATFASANLQNVEITPAAIGDLAANITRTAQSRGFVQGTHTGSEGVASIFQGAVTNAQNMGRNITLHELDQVVKNMGLQRPKIGSTTTTDLDQQIANSIFQEARAFMTNLQPRHVNGGNAGQISQAITEGRELSSRIFKMQEIQEAVHRATLHPPGQTYGEALKTQLRNFAKTKEFENFYTPGERAAVERIVRQSTVEGMARQASRISLNSPLLWGIVGTIGHSPAAGLGVAVAGAGVRVAGNAIGNQRVINRVQNISNNLAVGAPINTPRAVPPAARTFGSAFGSAAALAAGDRTTGSR